jgi:hydroxymethylpyrimidine/phosphomethylpyrimidine kinase
LVYRIDERLGETDMKKVLTIAGSDCSGGAGIQADIKTIAAHRMYGMSVITALTAQNTTGVYGVMEVEPEFVSKQIDCVFSDIRPDAVKIGMVSNAEIIENIADRLEEYGAENIVVDPVMVSTSGSRLLENSAREILIKRLFPLADVVTPNLLEAEDLCGFKIQWEEDMIRAAEIIFSMVNGSVLIKGGHLRENADDLLYTGSRFFWYRSERIDNPNTHGTGCTLSSAIACNLAAGNNMEESVRKGKAYITGALKAGLDLGRGSGPIDHGYACCCLDSESYGVI